MAGVIIYAIPTIFYIWINFQVAKHTYQNDDEIKLWQMVIMFFFRTSPAWFIIYLMIREIMG